MRISIVVTFSRPECADLVRKNLLDLDLGDHEVELLIMVDGNAEFPTDELFDKYPELTKHVMERGKPVTQNIPQVRSRIAHVRNESRELVGDTDFVFSFEDDMELPKNAMIKLHDHMYQDFGLVSGIQVGRHSRRILGAWKVDNHQFPKEGYSLGRSDLTEPLTEVDATGMYCYITPTNLYKEATYGWNEPFGPDVWYGLWLRTQGYSNYVDPTIICPHRSGDKTYVPDNDTIKLKIYQNQRGQWINEPVR